ncbi:MAG: hypothetical protein HYR64_06565 [Fimbriimonas ginsengisoli]|uniref:Lipoyl-binding domain-containing protein n=1 Tax=Fimbriimonas ginsengisoli TaxID=1005039 RepID=A0A931LV59_FIMGI|nr:hypothetical protein [Fimbriimonas ginsengisoli]
MAELDLELVRHALDTARRHGFAELELEAGGAVFRARLDQTPQAQTAKTPEIPAPDGVPIRAPLIGYYVPGAAPLELGMKVQPGDVIGVINALGIDNEVESSVSGEVIEVLVQDGEAVEFGQPLAIVRVAR